MIAARDSAGKWEGVAPLASGRSSSSARSIDSSTKSPPASASTISGCHVPRAARGVHDQVLGRRVSVPPAWSEREATQRCRRSWWLRSSFRSCSSASSAGSSGERRDGATGHPRVGSGQSRSARGSPNPKDDCLPPRNVLFRPTRQSAGGALSRRSLSLRLGLGGRCGAPHFRTVHRPLRRLGHSQRRLANRQRAVLTASRTVAR